MKLKNQSKGGFIMALGWMILMAVLGILYYMNTVAIWLSESIGITGEASFGVQVIVAVIGLFLLFSVIMFGIVLMILGIGYLKDITPFNLIEKFHKKIFGDTFSDRNFRL
ncbi:MAG: hypothetical protein KAS66_04085 [Candidatus Omnitrophica bacterium]|nr:hypothetical protein [Candidatus Omnitrophota bacterium]